MLVWKNKVEFETKIDYSEVTFYLSENIPEKGTEKFGEKDTVKDTVKITTVQQVILQEVTNNKYITIPELSEKAEINIRNTKSNIAKLKAQGLLERVGPDKGGYWKVIKPCV